MDRSFWRNGHTPTLFSAFLYFDLSFMVWYLLGPLQIQIAQTLALTTQQRSFMVATPILAGAILRGAAQTRRAWPVVRDGAVLGVVDRTALETLRGDGADKTLGALLASRVPDVAMPHETCRQIATRLAIHGLERLPVVADRTTMRLVGIVSRSDLVKLSLTHFEEEHKKERFRRIRIGNGKRRFPPVHKAG